MLFIDVSAIAVASEPPGKCSEKLAGVQHHCETTGSKMLRLF
jgi:hypothetical protein